MIAVRNIDSLHQASHLVPLSARRKVISYVDSFEVKKTSLRLSTGRFDLTQSIYGEGELRN